MSIMQSGWSARVRFAWAWLTFVEADDPVRYLLNRGFATILVVFALIDALLVPVLFLSDEHGGMLVALVALPIFFLMGWLNRRGTVYGAGLFTVWTILGVVLASKPSSYAGANTPIPLLLIFPIVTASLFIRPQAAWWVLVLLMIAHVIQLAFSTVPAEYAWRFLIVATLDLAAVCVLLSVGTSLFWRALQGSIAANKALFQSEGQFRTILETSPIPLVITRFSDGEILYANGHVSATLGPPSQETVGRNIAEFYFQPDTWTAICERLLKETSLQDIELQGKKVNGDSFWLVQSYERMTFDGQDAVIIAFNDITERKHMEANLVQLNTDLEQRVDQRTADLRSANDQLKELDKLKSKFVADVSHELRAPVTSLGLRLYLLEQTPQKLDEHLSVLKENVQRLTNLIESVLDLSRLDLNERTVAFGPVDLNAIIERESVGHLLPKQDAELNILYDLDKSLPPVRGEASQIGQVITNLVSNALRYTQAGTVQVRTSFASDSNAVCLEIIDSGIGIEPADMVHLFDRFYRGRNAVRSSIPGTGLGLSIVKDIVDLHEGRIEVESQPGQGSTFRVWLPVMPVIETAAVDNL
ncbi:MAG: PAS domain-containing sensor histidine kinase [Chloroflexota bacterium]